MINRKRKIRDISLKWKLLIPFLFLPTALTVLLVGWGLHGQYRALSRQEEARMRDGWQYLENRLALQLDYAGALSRLIAATPEVQQAISHNDRESLIKIYKNEYVVLAGQAGIKQFHFHVFPAKSLLRLHDPKHSGDLLVNRGTISKAYETGSTVTGIETGLTGFGMRGVSPVYFEGRLVGSIEIGMSLEQPFLERFKDDFGLDITLYQHEPESKKLPFRVLASTNSVMSHLDEKAYQNALQFGRVTFETLHTQTRELALLVGPIRDFSGKVAIVIELVRDRTELLANFREQVKLMVGLALVALLLAMLFVWRISDLFLQPINEMVDQAEKITAGERAYQVRVVANDEFGTLATALNRMLAGLEATQNRLKEQAQELEIRVRERTRELVISEEKFRNMVEHIPLVVYRLEKGLIRSFVSPYIESLTGWPPEEQVGGQAVWSGHIHPRHREKVVVTKERCLQNGSFFEMEYNLQDRHGNEVPILDHAVPVFDEHDRVLYMEGYMMDIREQKRLQEQAVQAEELKTLGDISARLAHEFRHPISVIGLSAKRLAKNMSASDPASAYSKILLEQAARLEGIINTIQTYIRPMGLRRSYINGSRFFKALATQLDEHMREKEIGLNLEMPADLPELFIDSYLMRRAFNNLVRNAVYQMPNRGMLDFTVAQDNRTVTIQLVYPAGYLPDDQLRHFFFPFTTEEEDTSLVDLPLVPVIIHKHNGVINVGRKGDDLVAVTIQLPSGDATV